MSRGDRLRSDDDPAMGRDRSSVRRLGAFWPLWAALILGAALRCYRVGANSLWSDEFATLQLASNSPLEILGLSSTANFIPPLYFLLVHGALRVLGETEAALRATSVVAGISTIPVMWLLTEEIARSHRAAHIAGALVAVNPLHLWFSQEARPYALVLLLATAALLSLRRALRTGSSGSWVAFTVWSTLAFITHTTAVILWVVAWIWALRLPGRRRVLRPLLASSLVIGVTCAPFALAIARALAATQGTFHSPPRALTGLEGPYTLLTFVTGFSFGPSPREIQNLGALAALRRHPLESALAGAVLAGVLVVAVFRRRATMADFLVLLGIPLVGVLTLSALSGKAYNVRYTLPALIGFLGMVSIAASTLRPRFQAFSLAALVGLSLWADAQWFRSARFWKEDSRAAVEWLQREVAPGARVAVTPGYMVEPLTYYAGKAGAELHFLPVGDNVAPGDTDALVLTRLHHVPNWREIRAGFVARSRRVRRGEVPGYEIICRESRPHREDF